MALLAIFRRLQLHRQSPFIRFSQLSHSPSQHLTASSLRCHIIYFSQAFHQTRTKPIKHTPHFGSGTQAHAQTPYQIINFLEYVDEIDEDIQLGLRQILERVEKAKDFASGDEAIAFLDNSNVKPDKDFIFSVIWALREEWKLAFLVFKWGEKWDCVVENTWCLMIWLLGNHKKFSTAWTLIHELYHASKDTQQAMLIMIDRYAAANYLDKAIQTFHLIQKFKFSPEQNTYFAFLNIICKHGNLEEAEEFMFLNKKFFPLEIDSFNIILNGWCNIAKDISEAKRVWREMSKSCIEPNGTSYTHMISCFSTVGNLFDSLRLYDEMKKRGWVPGVDVYHSLIYVMTRENCLTEALKIVDRMKETGLKPNTTTYNLIIRPLCEALKFEEARNVLARMIGDEISPTIDTYHAFLKGESLEGTLGVLDYMRKGGLGPNKDTFILVLEKFLKLGQHENALKMWSEMKEYEVKPNRSHYVVLVEGLAKYGLIEKARDLYSEMRCVLEVDDLLLKKQLEGCDGQEVRLEKGKGEMTVVRNIKKGQGLRCGRNSVVRSRKRRQR
ncbi:pentatricopeptide repeat-containing protein at1g80880 mitochondrial [Phtheirospermum japonicum]|uniref:Pentatricopeptide repeat-containing protein at1g80880 mitochondrial n=1 Tax=Phtheirospermum japonicum TaxID=374723 RepID=A0A830C3B4_9LAMI|nr:pentatricopeptide repeat-containing protein at1g80880 mitochondrial [Phtheirospermum japonicum]